jgi:predicted enzyme related to lactoylglutathione lyase
MLAIQSGEVYKEKRLFTVADVEESAAACLADGGTVVVEPRGLAGGRFCVIKDPGGSVAGLY